MARRHPTSHRLISIVGAAVVSLGLVILFGKVDGPAARLMTNLLGAAARTTLELLLSLVPSAWQVLQAYAFDHQQLSLCPLQMLVSFWPLLHVAGASKHAKNTSRKSWCSCRSGWHVKRRELTSRAAVAQGNGARFRCSPGRGRGDSMLRLPLRIQAGAEDPRGWHAAGGNC